MRDHEALLRMVDHLDPDVVILSIRNPVYATMATIQAARRLRLAYLLDDRLPDIDAVLGALHEVRAGRALLDPSIIDDLVRATTGDGSERLTPRESDVLEQFAGGLSNSAIAAEVHLSTKAVEKYITTISASSTSPTRPSSTGG